MMETLVAMYEKGAITADHLVVQSLHMIDPQDPGLVLASLPPDILTRVMQYACEYQPKLMRTNYGLQPTLGQVEAAKEWMGAKIVQ